MERYRKLMDSARTWAEEHRRELVAELQSWVRIPSVSRADLAAPGMPFGPECRRMLDHAMERGQFFGFDVQDHDGCACSITMGDAEKCIGVVAHLDVVPEGEGWVYPPYGATYLPEYDVVIGRGADDNKGSAIAALFAMRALREMGWPMKHGIRMLLGTSEETGMQDMKQLRANGMEFPKLSLVPDAGFPVNYGQKGGIDGEISFPCSGNLLAFEAGAASNSIPSHAACIVALSEEQVCAALAVLDEAERAALTVEACDEGCRIIAAGRAGHAAFPAGGDSAIRRLTKVLTAAGLLTGTCSEAIRQAADLTNDPYGQSEGVACRDEISGELTLVYGMARLENERLYLSVDCRFPIRCRSSKLTDDLYGAWTARGATIESFDMSEAFYIPKDSPEVQLLQEIYRTATGRDDPPYTMGGGTYSRVVPHAISFGPGMPGKRSDFSAFLPSGHGSYHGPDEAVCIEKLHDCLSIYAGALAALDDLLE